MAGIFHEYDIRGVYPEEINDRVMARVALAFCTYAKARNARRILVGHDARHGSKEMAFTLATTLASQGFVVHTAGLVTGPMTYVMAKRLHYDYGLYVTASHNPKQYNGLKIVGKDARTIFLENGLEVIERIYSKQRTKTKAMTRTHGKGQVLPVDIATPYYGLLVQQAHRRRGLRRLRIVIDCSNGAVGPHARHIFDRLGQHVRYLNDLPDGDFPNHAPNPMIDHACIMASHAVKQHGADLGIVFDGDGDRLRVIDEHGHPVRPDILFGILAHHEIASGKRGIFFGDLRLTRAVEESIKAKAVYRRMRVGNPFYKVALAEKGAVLAGELSGHIMYKEHDAVDDAFFAAIKLLEAMGRARQPLSALARPFHRYYSSGEINIKSKDADALLARIRRALKGMRSARLDGYSFQTDEAWCNARKSNTEPLVRIVAEAKTKEALAALLRKIRSAV